MTIRDLYEEAEARYIDANKLIRDLIDNKEFYPALVKSAIENAPTEDVVPESEVELDEIAYKSLQELYDNDVKELSDNNERLRAEVEELTEERDKYKKYYFRHEYDKWEAEIKQEVAREIFEKIEKLLCANASGEFREESKSWFDYFDLHLSEDFAELKKKYIGEGK